MSLALVNARLYTPCQAIEPGWVLVEGERLAGVGAGPAPAADHTLDLGGRLLAPGFIDIHTHGAVGFDVMDEAADALPAISAFLAEHGCTGWLPTTLTAQPERITRRLAAIAEAAQGKPQGARVLGAHVEGPYFSLRGTGAQPAQYLDDPTPEKAARLLGDALPWVRTLSLAPELPGAVETIGWLAGQGIAPCLGHTWATYEQFQAAVAAGARHATHLYSAMRPFDKRDPGIIGGVWTQPGFTAEVICDLIHAHPAALQVARTTKGPDDLVLVTDAMLATGRPPGRYELGGQEVMVDERVALLSGSLDDPANAVLAGSVLTIDQAVRNAHLRLGWPLPEVLACVTANPARVIGLADRKGRLQAGYDADLVVLDGDLAVMGTMVGGEWMDRDSRLPASSSFFS